MDNEVDVGNAITTLAHQQALQQRHQQQLPQQHHRHRKRLRSTEENPQLQQHLREDDEPNSLVAEVIVSSATTHEHSGGMNNNLMDSADEEQHQAALGSLIRNDSAVVQKPQSQTATPMLDEEKFGVAAAAASLSSGMARRHDDDKDPTLLLLLQDENYYWRQGYTAPPNDQLPFYYLKAIQRCQPELDKGSKIKHYQNKEQQKQQQQQEEDQLRERLKGNQSSNHTEWYNQYFPLSRQYLESRSNYIHPRQLLQLASRYIIVTSCGDDGVNNDNHTQQQKQQQQQQRISTIRRLLRLLLSNQKNIWHVTRLQLLLQQSQEYAKNLLLFRQTRWHSQYRIMVATRLGLAAIPECGITGGLSLLWTDQLPISWLSGYCMDRHKVAIISKRVRRQLIQTFGDGTIPNTWSKSTHNNFSYPNEPMTVPSIFETTTTTTSSNSNRNSGFFPETGGRHAPYPPAHNNVSSSSRRRLDVFVSSDYSHLPGSTPPVPSFPLDELQTMFGPIDHHANASYANNSRLDVTTYELTVCSLVTLWLSALQLQAPWKDTSSSSFSSSKSWLSHLKSFIEHAPHLTSNRLYKRLLLHRNQIQTDNFPLVPYYCTIMGYCSLVANLPLVLLLSSTNSSEQQPLSSPHRRDDVDDSENEDHEDVDQVQKSDFSLVARNMHEYCQNHVEHNSLQHFPKLQIVFGLVSVAKMLPPSAAELLSRPTDHLWRRTPIDIIRLTLEYMENERMLLDVNAVASDFVSSTTVHFVNAGELEYQLFKASEIFAISVFREPENLDYHAWYLSALSGCLLLCSGIRIGSKPQRFPSRKSSTYNKSINPLIDLRCKLPKFDQVRGKVGAAFQRLVQLSNEKNDWPRSHLIVSCFLEWQQVVGLLIRSASEAVQSVRLLHQRHVLSWVLTVPQQSSLFGFIRHLRDSNVMSRNDYLSYLATAIENNPNQLQIWRAFVGLLGPVGVCVSTIQKADCRKNSCRECARLRLGLNVDHEPVEANKRSCRWWGRSRVSWWLNHQLRIVVSSDVKKTSTEAYGLIERQILTTRLLPIVQTKMDVDRTDECQPVTDDDLLSWLPVDAVSDDSGDKDDASIDFESLDDSLPAPFHEIIDSADFGENDESCLLLSISENNKHLEAICYKVIITCHLYDNTQENISRAVDYLASRCFRNKSGTVGVDTSCDEWQCLIWLASYGLNVGRILHRTRSNQEIPKVTCYTLQEQKAVQVGVARFGVGWWSEIQKNSKVLQDSSNDRVRDIYRWMLKEGMLT